MLKKSLLLFVIIVTMMACEPSETKKDIKKITEKSFAVLNQQIKNTTFDGLRITEFNLKGEEVVRRTFDKDSALEWKVTSIYDNGNRIQEDWFLDEDEERIRYLRFTYNEDDKISKTETYDGSNEVRITDIHDWNSEDNSEKVTTYLSDKSILRVMVNYYNDSDDKVKTDYFNKKDSIKENYSWKFTKFNDDNQWIEKQFFVNDSLARVISREFIYFQN